MDIKSMLYLLFITSSMLTIDNCEGGYGHGGYGKHRGRMHRGYGGYGGHHGDYGGHGHGGYGGGYGDYGGGYGGYGGGGHGGGYGGYGGGYGGHGGGYGGHGGGYGGHGEGYGGHGGGYGGHGGGYGGHGGGYGGHGGGYGGHGGGYGGHGGGYGGGGYPQAHYHFYPVYKKKGFAVAGGLLAGLATGLAAGLLQAPVIAAAAAGKKRSVPEEPLRFNLKYGPALRKQLAQIEGEKLCNVALHVCDMELARLMSKRKLTNNREDINNNVTMIRNVDQPHSDQSAATSNKKGDGLDGNRSELGFIMCSQLLPKCSQYYYTDSPLDTSSIPTYSRFFQGEAGGSADQHHNPRNDPEISTWENSFNRLNFTGVM